jgi:alpha-beta hydrolase superfamily lysophospholipase
MEQPAIKQISIDLYKFGHNIFSFNFSKSAQGIALEQQVSDINSIIEYFSGYSEIIVMGGSLGALCSAIATIQNRKVKGLASTNGFFGSYQLDKKAKKLYLLFRLAALFNTPQKQIWQYLKKEFKPEKITIPVLVIHSKADKVVSIKQSQQFYKRLQTKKEFHVLEKADHELTTGQSVKEVVKIIDTWLRTIA